MRIIPKSVIQIRREICPGSWLVKNKVTKDALLGFNFCRIEFISLRFSSQSKSKDPNKPVSSPASSGQLLGRLAQVVRFMPASSLQEMWHKVLGTCGESLLNLFDSMDLAVKPALKTNCTKKRRWAEGLNFIIGVAAASPGRFPRDEGPGYCVPRTNSCVVCRNYAMRKCPRGMVAVGFSL